MVPPESPEFGVKALENEKRRDFVCLFANSEASPNALAPRTVIPHARLYGRALSRGFGMAYHATSDGALLTAFDLC